MKYLIILASLLLCGFVSPFPSTVEGIGIPNTHKVGEGIYRGMAPRNQEDFRDLVEFGIEKVLIFKDQKRGEVDKEIASLKANGFEDQDFLHIPFKWKELDGFSAPCEQVITALEVLLTSGDEGLFFHCTVGEDRTGLLTGIYKMLTEGVEHREVFQTEMCENGYAAGNPRKPYYPVVKPIREGLTPLFAKLAWLVSEEVLTIESVENLDFSMCQNDPEEDEKFRVAAEFTHSSMRCETSSKYKPK